jgi:hypothetical protein
LVLAAFALGLAGVAGGLMLGLGLRAPVAPPRPAPTDDIPRMEPRGLEPRAEAPPPSPAAPPSSVAQPTRTELTEDLAALRAAIAAEQARLDELTQARAAAERDLAASRRDLATAPPRREAAAPPPAAAPRPPRAEAVAMPPAAPGQPRVFVHMRTGSPAAAEAAAGLAAQLRDAGFEVADMRAVTSTPSQRVVRYFYAEDAAAAARLAGRLGRGWAIQDFRTYEPAPPPQTLEIWLPDR